MMDSCLVGEEIAYGCTGIMTAIVSNGLAVSLKLLRSHLFQDLVSKCIPFQSSDCYSTDIYWKSLTLNLNNSKWNRWR